MHARSGLPLQQEFRGIARIDAAGEIVSAFGYDSFQPYGCQLHLCTEAPLTRDLLRTAFMVPFIQWNYSFLLAIIQEQNRRSLNMAARLGFTEIAAVPGHLRIATMYKADCRWIYLAERAKCPAAPRLPPQQI